MTATAPAGRLSVPRPSRHRVLIMAEMHGRDLIRRHIALALLVALPLAFYLSSARDGVSAVPSGGVSLAFAIGGATIFSAISSLRVDQRLVLGGYRPIELLLGRLMFLGPLGLLIAAVFSGLMITVSHPSKPWLVLLGTAFVALEAVPFGLAVASAVPRELEGTLVLIGVVGVQLAAGPAAPIAKLLPFYGPLRIIDAGIGENVALWPAIVHAVLYALALLMLTRALIGPKLGVRGVHKLTP
jgi:hypothetical protein